MTCATLRAEVRNNKKGLLLRVFAANAVCLALFTLLCFAWLVFVRAYLARHRLRPLGVYLIFGDDAKNESVNSNSNNNNNNTGLLVTSF